LNPVRFGTAEFEVLSEVQPIAEELVGEHFHVTSFGPQHRCYEVVTLATGPDECREPTALAKLCRYDRQERAIGGGQHVARFYRIGLQDDRLLARAFEGLDLRALLLYVMTHELIHVVRFESYQIHFEATGLAREREERIVHGLTEQVLAPLKRSRVDEVARGLAAGGVDVLFTQR
jgi:hypothetical protein